MSMVHVAVGAHVGTLLYISKSLVVHDSCCHQRPCWCPFPDHCCSLRLCWWSWSILPPEDKWLPIAWAAAWGHVVVCGLICHWAPCICLWFLLLPKAMLCVACIVVWGDVNVYGLCCYLRPCQWLWSAMPLGCMLMSIVCTASGRSDKVYCLCCPQGSCWCPSSMVQPEAMWMSMVHAATVNHVDVNDLCWDPINVHVAAGCYRQENTCWSGINDSRLIIQNLL